ncbi:hypothetical protein [Nocardioides sp. zg-DK7169]|nr:hypothetical protein [Nocardioides sp. zg-DK7169]NPC96473.1 hypothetical protein [Nocardioides sp. zg-DK7169]
MGLWKKAASLALAKKVYDEARKPQNQARLRSATSRVQDEVAKRRRPAR